MNSESDKITVYDGNRIIAEYVTDNPSVLKMDIEHHAGTLESMHYHDSWDWLMPVVDKIEKEFAWVTIKGSRTQISTVVDISANSKIEATWLAVVEFLKLNDHRIKKMRTHKE